MLIADLVELETMDASEICLKIFNAQENCDISQTRRFLFFQSQMDANPNQTPGGDQDLRTSTLVRPRPNRGDGHIDFLGESEGSFSQTYDSFPVAGEAMHDFWSMSGSFIYPPSR